MPKISQNNRKVNKPIRFELVDDDPKITLGDVILNNIENLTKREHESDVYGGDPPEYLCWMCGKNFTLINGDMCSWCVDEQAKIEKELLEGE